MTIIYLTGQITQQGELKVKLPDDLPPGEVRVMIEITPHIKEPQAKPETDPNVWENQSWTDEEIRKLITVEPLTGHEIVERGLTGGWEHYGIRDSVEWLEEERRKRQELLKW